MPIRPECRDLYPPDWPELSRTIRVERAEGRCECTGECGHDHGAEASDHQIAFQAAWGMADPTAEPHERCMAHNTAEHPITGSIVVLTVAHLDHDPTNCNHKNLKAMCQRCHLAYDREHHRQTRRNRLAIRDLFETEEVDANA